MITISNSNKSNEITTLIPILKHLHIPLIYITDHPKNNITHTANIHLYIKITKKTYPLKLTPTNNTTATLIINDTLAIALLKTHNFTTENFTLSHPNDTLNHKLLLHINDIIHTNDKIPHIKKTTNLHNTLLKITHKNLNITIIYDNNIIIKNIFTDNDLHHIFDININIHQLNITDIITPKKIHIHPNILTIKTLNLIQSRHITSIIITDNDHLLDILHIHNLLHTNII